MLLEIAVFNLESALIAQESGANRIELCSAPAEGGLTPSFGIMSSVRKNLEIPVNVMIRPREGDFYYSELEFESMLMDIELAKSTGMDGIVAGVLKKDGTIDEIRTSLLIEASYPLPFTFHRAFDMSNDLENSLKTLIRCGCKRILSSGGKNKALDGIEMLKKLLQQANQKIIVMPGSGININNVLTFKNSGFNEIHLSARSYSKSQMNFKKEEPQLGGNSFIPDYELLVPDKTTIRQILKALEL